MSRRLPVYLLVDCSESMIGGGLDSVRHGISTMVTKLRTDPHALDTVHLSVITFDLEARVATPLTPLPDFQEPALTVRAGTSLGAGLNMLASRIASEVRKTTHDSKGDYRPLVLLLTDGQPTDDWRTPLSKIGTQVKPRPANIYAIGCGLDVDYSILQNITDVVLRMDDMGPESFAKLFVWLTASVTSASQGVGGGEVDLDKIKLEKLPGNVSAVEGKAAPLPDGPPRQIFLRARCSYRGEGYLMRYRFDSLVGCYQPVTTHRLTAEEARTNATMKLPDIRSGLLNGACACPYCEKPGAGSCGNCGTIFCSDPRDLSDSKCPGCGKILKFGPRGGHSDGFNVPQSAG